MDEPTIDEELQSLLTALEAITERAYVQMIDAQIDEASINILRARQTEHQALQAAHLNLNNVIASRAANV